MPIRKEVFVNGAFYHIYNRGFLKRKIFVNQQAIHRFISLMKFCKFNYKCKFSYFNSRSKQEQKEITKSVTAQDQNSVEIVAYCIMPNHFHLLLMQEIDDGLLDYMTRISNAFAHYYNLKFNKKGPVFEGRFKSVMVENNQQLLHLSRYIHLNPCTAGLVKKKEIVSYKNSSLVEYINENNILIVKPEIVLDQFGSRKKYLEFVMDSADWQRELQIIKKQLIDVDD